MILFLGVSFEHLVVHEDLHFADDIGVVGFIDG